jgi:hypothetical protein
MARIKGGQNAKKRHNRTLSWLKVIEEPALNNIE